MKKAALLAGFVLLLIVRTARAGDTGTLRVEVVGPDGGPVGGAQVVLTDPKPSGFKREGRTDGAGRARFAGLAPGELVLRVTREGFAVYETSFTARAGETAVKKVALAPAGARTEAAPASTPPSDPAMAAYNEAVKLLHQSRPDESLAKLDEALKAKPDFTLALALKGIVLERQNRCAEAIPVLKAAESGGQPEPEALSPLIRCLEKSGLAEEAARYRRMQSQTLRTASDLYNEAVTRINAGDDAGAAPLLEQALGQDAGYAPAQYQYGLILFRRGDVAGAVSRLETYLELAPEGEFSSRAKELLKAMKPS